MSDVHEDADFNAPQPHYRDFIIKLPKKNHQSDFLNADWWYQRGDWNKIFRPEFLAAHKLWWRGVEPHIVEVYKATFIYDEYDAKKWVEKYGLSIPYRTMAVVKVLVCKDKYGYPSPAGAPAPSEYYLSVPPYSSLFIRE